MIVLALKIPADTKQNVVKTKNTTRKVLPLPPPIPHV